MYDTANGGTPQPVHTGPSLFSVAIIALVFGAVGGVAGMILTLRANTTGRIDLERLLGIPQTVAAAPAPGGSSKVTMSLPDFKNVADSINASVVNINTTSRQVNPYEYFFEEIRGLGAGVIVDEKGDILTNYHVVKGANNIQVTVVQGSSHQSYKAELIEGDEQEDLAVVKINAPNLHPVKFGDSDKLQAGEWVMAIGNPYGFEHTVSVGVVSALNRSLPAEDGNNMYGMIQTDASINPGNSGGPLVNLNGELIGINSAIYVGNNSSGVQASGLGFSIPSNRAKRDMVLLRDKKPIQHPHIGIHYDLITEDIRQSKHLPAQQGIVIDEVDPGSPAEKAKLKVDDVITDVDGVPITQEDTLRNYVTKQTVGSTITLTIYRDVLGFWTQMAVKVTLEETPTKPSPSDIYSTPDQPNEPNFPFPFPF